MPVWSPPYVALIFFFLPGKPMFWRGCRLGRTHGQIVDYVAVAVFRRRGSRSEAAKDDIAGTAPVRWTVEKLER